MCWKTSTAILIIIDARYHDFNGFPVVNQRSADSHQPRPALSICAACSQSSRRRFHDDRIEAAQRMLPQDDASPEDAQYCFRWNGILQAFHARELIDSRSILHPPCCFRDDDARNFPAWAVWLKGGNNSAFAESLPLNHFIVGFIFVAISSSRSRGSCSEGNQKEHRTLF